jgi:hypothetical protein
MRTFPGVIGVNDSLSLDKVLKSFNGMCADAQSYDARANLQAKWLNCLDKPEKKS